MSPAPPYLERIDEMPEIYEVEYCIEDNWITCPFNQDEGACEIEEIDCFTLSHRIIPDDCPIKTKGGVLVMFKEK